MPSGMPQVILEGSFFCVGVMLCWIFIFLLPEMLKKYHVYRKKRVASENCCFEMV